jgi:hypothetical protein
MLVLQAYNHFLHQYGEFSNFTMIADVDEFMVQTVVTWCGLAGGY